MAPNYEPDFIVLASRKCPHLGLLEDEKTWSATDQMQNYCHFEEKAEPVEWSHQCENCFSDGYSACPVLNARVREAKAASWRLNPKLRFSLLLLLALIVLTAIGVTIRRSGFPPLFQSIVASPAKTQSSILINPALSTPTSTRLLVLPTPAPSLTPTEKIEPSPTLAATKSLPPQPSFTPTATVYFTATTGPGLNTPFGVQTVYVAHRVTAGESLEMLARIYNTTDAVLRAVNNLGPDAVLWFDVDLVILPGLKDVTGVQPRKPVYIEWNTTVQELADKYKVPVEQLRADNGLSSDDFFPGKRWLVVPLVP